MQLNGAVNALPHSVPAVQNSSEPLSRRRPLAPFPPLRIPIYYLHEVSQWIMCLSGEADENDSAIEGDFRTHEVGPCRLCAQQGACHGIARICGGHSMARGSIGGAMRRHAAERRDVCAYRSAVTMLRLSPSRRRPLGNCCSRVRGSCLHCMGILPEGLALRNPGILPQRHMRRVLRVSMGPSLCRHAA